MRERREELSELVAAETGKPHGARARRDRRGDRDGPVRRRRGPAALRPDDDGEHAAPQRLRRARPGRRRRAAHVVQHAAAEHRLEGVPGRPLRQRGGREAVGGGARLGARVRADRARVRASGRRPQRRPGARRRGGRAARRAPGRRPRQLHRLGGDRTGDQRGRRPPAREGLPGARRQERARRLRRRRPRRRRPLGARVGLLERGAALRGGEPARRLRRGLRRRSASACSPARRRSSRSR